MALVVSLMQGYLLLSIAVVTLYALRHLIFALVRVYGRQRPGHQDLLQNDWPTMSVLVPMHNEGQVADGVMKALLACDYPPDRLEIVPVDDHSYDNTAVILREYAHRHPQVRPVYRRGGDRGKPESLNEAMQKATGDIVVTFDADYLPPRGILKMLAQPFADPEVGAVMGRVVPHNAGRTLLTRLLDLERTGGYQADQQARYTLGLIVQYGGTVGGFRRGVVSRLGGFVPGILAEDTDLTFRLYAAGWRVAYANRAECYEEVPENWPARYTQLRRWARGHTQTLMYRLPSLLRSPYLSFWQKLDGVFLLGVYLIPPLLFGAFLASLLLFVSGELPVSLGLLWTLAAGLYGAFGNFAPFYEVGAATLADGARQRILLLPGLLLAFLFNLFAVSQGVGLALWDRLLGRVPGWEKTRRFRRV